MQRLEETGDKESVEHRFHFQDDHYQPRSPWHDIPLRIARSGFYNAVIEIPLRLEIVIRYFSHSGLRLPFFRTSIKYEAQTTEEYNPIGPDTTKDGVMR